MFTPRVEEYYLPVWFIGITLGYFVTYLLVKAKKVSLLAQRKFWNAVLFVSFLVTAVSGILMVFRSQYHVSISLPFDIKFWHVEIGIAFAVVAIFHALWHLAYFKGYFRK